MNSIANTYINLDETHFTLQAVDDYFIPCHRWAAEQIHRDEQCNQYQNQSVRGIVQIAHGMGEHSLRYRHIAESLVAAGYIVYANEHRGHGQQALSRGELGDFGPQGFPALVNDMATLTYYVKEFHPNLPIILLGHSMGSFAVQRYLIEFAGLLDGVVLSGTTAVDLLGTAVLEGFRLEEMNSALPDVRTPFDWLSRDPFQVDQYISDPLCGFTVTDDSMTSIFTDCAVLAEPATLKQIPVNLPMYLFTGDHDPVNNHLQWFHPLLDRYWEAGLQDVSYHIFGGARHETLNEINREEVVAVLLCWLQRVINDWHTRPRQ